MLHRDPRCVFVSDDPGVANDVASCLTGEGMPAQVMNRATLGGLLGPNVSGVEVWVTDPEQAERALKLIAQRAEFKPQRTEAIADDGPVIAACEECGHTMAFAGEDRGTIQMCPNCGDFLDVPGGEDDFDWSDTGDAEDEEL